MPVFNVERYVERAILSVYNQTYKNIELIIVDDCGTDNSMNVVLSTIKKYDTKHVTKIYHHEFNRGLSAARNTGMDHVNGKYVYFMDSDDEITYDCIDRLVSLIICHPNVEVVVGNMSIVDVNGIVINKNRYFVDSNKEIDFSNDVKWITRYTFDYSKNHYIPATSTNKLYLYDFLLGNNLRFVEGLISEDEKFLFDLSNCIGNISICYEPTYVRYINPNSIMTTLTADVDALNWIKIIKSSYRDFKEPYIDLKCKYCIIELKSLLFSVSVTNNSIINQIKDMLIKISKFSFSHKMYQPILYSFLLIIFPIKLRSLNIINKIYNRIFSPKRMLKY